MGKFQNRKYASKAYINKAYLNHIHQICGAGMDGMNVILRGKALQIINSMVKNGYANTKSEAIRLAVLSFWDRRTEEEILVSRKLDRIDKDVREGKRKTLNAKEALGEYAKYLQG